MSVGSYNMSYVFMPHLSLLPKMCQKKTISINVGQSFMGFYWRSEQYWIQYETYWTSNPYKQTDECLGTPVLSFLCKNVEKAPFCPRPGGLKRLLTRDGWIGEVMVLISAELLFHGHYLSTQLCIETGPSGDLRNAEKHHVAAETFRPPCKSTLYFHRSPRPNLQSVLTESAVVSIWRFLSHIWVRWWFRGVVFTMHGFCQLNLEHIGWVCVTGSCWTEEDLKEYPMKSQWFDPFIRFMVIHSVVGYKFDFSTDAIHESSNPDGNNEPLSEKCFILCILWLVFIKAFVQLLLYFILRGKNVKYFTFCLIKFLSVVACSHSYISGCNMFQRTQGC